MRDVEVKKSELLMKIKANRAEHRSLFERAQVGFRKRAIEHLDKMLADAKAGREIALYVGLQAPIDKTSDYDRVIGMLEMSVEETIDLDEKSYAQYVLDDWSWKQNVAHLNSSYL